MSDRDVRARVLLSRLSEPVDAHLNRRIIDIGAIETAAELVAGTSPLRNAESLRIRLDRNDPEHMVDADLASAERVGARVITPGTSAWPTQLDQLGERAPLLLWVLGSGDLRLLALRSVAMVGARAATSYGETVARRWSADFVTHGWTVVSGGAFGIDAAAHRGALAAGGATVCILASGVDVPYPRSHDLLLAQIAENGLVVSESPPGSSAMRQRFLTRNRLIAAISRATVVVEAALRSGARSTAGEAAELARPVFAVPGPVTSVSSAGCHALIRQHAAELVAGSDDVLSLLDPLGVAAPIDREPGRVDDGLATREARVLDAVPLRKPASMTALVRTAGLTPTEVVAALGHLQSRGLVRRTSDGWVKQARQESVPA
jgi:DNA processing protein